MSYVGSSIGSIRIESRLGEGGMGEVYLGYDPRLDCRVALDSARARTEAREALRILATLLKGEPDESARG